MYIGQVPRTQMSGGITVRIPPLNCVLESIPPIDIIEVAVRRQTKINRGQTRSVNIMVLGSAYGGYFWTVYQKKSDICLRLESSFLSPRRPSDEQALYRVRIWSNSPPKGQSLDSPTICEEEV